MSSSERETKELLKKVRRIELRTRRKSDQVFSGEYSSAFKGRGMAFSEVREYIAGDPIRTIDWNVTARTGTPHVKVFQEERELTVMLLVDMSASDEFGTQGMTKRELITEISAVLSVSAIKNSDKVGVIIFTDRIEKYIPPRKGRSHILKIIHELVRFKPAGRGTDIRGALEYLNRLIKTRTISFLLSDFLDKDFEEPLRIANKRHDCIALQISDRHEFELPDIGLALFYDKESGRENWIDTSSKRVRRSFAEKAQARQEEIEAELQKAMVDHEQLFTDESYEQALIRLFNKR